MRIWIINHYALPPSSAGGTRHYNFAKQLMRRGHDVTLIAANYDHFSHAYISSSAKRGELDHTYDVPFLWVPTPAYQGNTVKRFWNMLVFSRRLLQKKYLPHTSPPDVIIGSSPHLFSAFSAYRLAKHFKVPFILEIRDIWPDTLVDLGKISNHHPLIILMKRIELYLYKRANRIISLLPSAYRYLIQSGVAAEKVLWLPNAVEADIAPQQVAPPSNKKFTIMYAGAHGLANDLHTVLDAAKILMKQSLANNIQICLVGEGPEKVRLKDRVINENITIVELRDAVGKDKIYSVLNQADVFLMLLKNSPIFRWGISPNKLFDYLLMGRPVIFGVDTPFNPIETHQAGISIQPSNAEALAAAMGRLALLPKNELEAMGARGKEFVLKNHNISYLTDSLENLIQEVML